MKYSMGIDLGGTHIGFAFLDECFTLIQKTSIDTPKGVTGPVLADTIAASAKEFANTCNIDLSDLQWIGIGAPGHVDSDTGELIFACNLGLSNSPLAALLEERTGCKVYIGNDANAAAYGEAMVGAAKGASSSVTVTLGTGIGMGIVFGNKIHVGYHFCAGEGGHMVIVAGGRACNCGRRGCFETYASATGLIRSTKEAMEQHPESLLWKLCGGNIEKVNGRTAFDAKEQGDTVAVQVVDEYIYYLACGIVNIINLLEPEIICIGGGISAQGEALMEPLRKLVKQEQYSRLEQTTKLVAANLGNDAGLIGAALLGCQYQE